MVVILSLKHGFSMYVVLSYVKWPKPTATLLYMKVNSFVNLPILSCRSNLFVGYVDSLSLSDNWCKLSIRLFICNFIDATYTHKTPSCFAVIFLSIWYGIVHTFRLSLTAIKSAQANNWHMHACPLSVRGWTVCAHLHIRLVPPVL